jgi:hypothetical protein
MYNVCVFSWWKAHAKCLARCSLIEIDTAKTFLTPSLYVVTTVESRGTTVLSMFAHLAH